MALARGPHPSRAGPARRQRPPASPLRGPVDDVVGGGDRVERVLVSRVSPRATRRRRPRRGRRDPVVGSSRTYSVSPPAPLAQRGDELQRCASPPRASPRADQGEVADPTSSIRSERRDLQTTNTFEASAERSEDTPKAEAVPARLVRLGRERRPAHVRGHLDVGDERPALALARLAPPPLTLNEKRRLPAGARASVLRGARGPGPRCRGRSRAQPTGRLADGRLVDLEHALDGGGATAGGRARLGRPRPSSRRMPSRRRRSVDLPSPPVDGDQAAERGTRPSGPSGCARSRLRRAAPPLWTASA